MGARDQDRVCLGAVAGAHGVRGEVRIKAFTEDPLDVAAYGPVTTADGSRTFEIEAARLHKAVVVARLGGVADRNAAEALKGTRLYVPRARLPAPDEEETWYHADLIGLEAVRTSGAPVGRVVAIQDYGAGVLLEIEIARERRTVFVPFTRDYVPLVEPEAGRVVLDVPDDMLDAETAPLEDEGAP